MSYWEILDISPTLEASIIKKAYAKKLKIFHPEDDPHGFQRVREAYDSALRYAKNNQLSEVISTNPIQAKDNNRLESSSYIEESNSYVDDDRRIKINNIHEDNYVHKDYEINDIYPISNGNINLTEDFVNDAPDNNQLMDEFFERIDEVYNDFFLRIEEKKWEEILNMDIMWQLEVKEILNERVLKFIMNHYHLPQNIWKLLNSYFHWDENKEELYYDYPQDFIDYIFKQLSRDKLPRYNCFSKAVEISYEEYVKHRGDALIALFRDNLEGAIKYITLAYEIYPNDPDLVCLMGDYYLRIRNYKKAFRKFKEALKINPKDIYVYFFQAEIMFNNGNISDAIKVSKRIKKLEGDDFDANLMLAKCYLEIGELYKAKKLLLSNLKIKPDDIETREYLKKLANKMLLKLNSKPLNFRMRYNLKAVYASLGEFNGIIGLKISIREYKALLKFLLYAIIIIIIILAGIAHVGFITVIFIRFIFSIFKKDDE